MGDLAMTLHIFVKAADVKYIMYQNVCGGVKDGSFFLKTPRSRVDFSVTVCQRVDGSGSRKAKRYRLCQHVLEV